MEQNRYFVIDSGEQMIEYAELIIERLRKDGCHFINYSTDQPYFLGVEEVTEDEFLKHFKPYGQA